MAAQSVEDSRPRIVVGPNILVSRERDGNMGELLVAADPTNPNNLIGTGIHFHTGQPNGPQKTRVYHSADGGYSWSMKSPPEGDFKGDPVVAYGRTGTGYYHTIGREGAEDVQWFYRSEDGGRTWQKPTILGYADHPQIVVDQSDGRFAGNVYISGLMSHDEKQVHEGIAGPYDFHLGVWRSTDDGRSWSGPVDFVDNHGLKGRNVQTLNLCLFTDGNLFAPFSVFPVTDEARTADPRAWFRFVISSDGGTTFTPPQKFTIANGDELDINLSQLGGWGPFFAIDNSEGPYRDRIYMVWITENFDRSVADKTQVPVLLMSHSADRGETWSAPRRVAISSATDRVSGPGPASIAVNHDGVVAVSWYASRKKPGARSDEYVSYDRYLTVSIDGGESFLPHVRVSSASSDGDILSRNLAGAQTFDHWITVVSGGHSHGEYLGLAADKEGAFHEFWMDGRTGRAQIWTATIRVAYPGTSGQQPVTLIASDVTDRLEAWLDPLAEFAAPGLIEIPVRLRNKSDQPIYGPITLEIEHICGNPCGQIQKDGTVERLRTESTILNASNGKEGAGATFDYSGALGGMDSLPQGAITEAVTWRLRSRGADFPSIRFKVKAKIPESTPSK